MTIDELQEELFKKGAAGELLDNWRRVEEAELREVYGKLDQPIPVKTRAMALQLMGDLVVLRGLGFQSWCETVNLFDVFCIRVLGREAKENTNWNRAMFTSNVDLPKALEPSQLVITCVAVVRLVEKSNRGTASRPMWNQDVAQLISALLEHVRGSMPIGPEWEPEMDVDNNMLMQREIDVLTVLGMRLTARPSFYDWLSILGIRFGVLSRGKLAPTLDWVWNYGMGGAQVIFRATPVSPELLPRRIAVGLFALGLVFAGVLPLSAFKPADVTDEEWQQRMSKSCPGPNAAMPVCHVPQTYWNSLLDILQAASRCDIKELQAHVFAVAAAIPQD
jgi:hypothetical protein